MKYLLMPKLVKKLEEQNLLKYVTFDISIITLVYWFINEDEYFYHNLTRLFVDDSNCMDFFVRYSFVLL